MGGDQDPAARFERLTYAADGTPFAARFDDVYCSRSGRGQAAAVFVGGNRVVERCAKEERFAILETGLGLGLNLVATLEALAAAERSRPLELRYAAIELYPVHPEDLARVHGEEPREAAEAFVASYGELVDRGEVEVRVGGNLRVTLELRLADGAAALDTISGVFDALYLDGFAPAKNPGLWSDEVFAALARRSAAGATIATYSAAGRVREGLRAAGFEVDRLEGFGRKRHRLEGRYCG